MKPEGPPYMTPKSAGNACPTAPDLYVPLSHYILVDMGKEFGKEAELTHGVVVPRILDYDQTQNSH